MNQITASFMGIGICCVVPILAFLAGIYYARHGMPFEVRWRRHHHDEEA